MRKLNMLYALRSQFSLGEFKTKNQNKVWIVAEIDMYPGG